MWTFCESCLQFNKLENSKQETKQKQQKKYNLFKMCAHVLQQQQLQLQREQQQRQRRVACSLRQRRRQHQHLNVIVAHLTLFCCWQLRRRRQGKGSSGSGVGLENNAQGGREAERETNKTHVVIEEKAMKCEENENEFHMEFFQPNCTLFLLLLLLLLLYYAYL